MMKNIVFFILYAFIVSCMVSCSATPEVDTSNTAGNPGGMAKVKHSGFDNAFVDPGSNLKGFKAFMFAPLETSSVEVVNPEIQNSRKSDWEFSEKDAMQMSKAYMKAVKNAFKKNSGMSLADKAGPGVILVKSKLTRFAPNAPKFNSIDRTPRSKFYAKSSASFTLETELLDSQSSKQLATIIESREMGDDLNMEEITTARYVMDMKMGFDRWARNFKSNFDKMMGN